MIAFETENEDAVLLLQDIPPINKYVRK